MTALFAIYGAGGCGRGIMPLAREQLRGRGAELVFVDDHAAGDRCNGHEVLSFDEFCATPATEKRVAVAVAQSTSRATIAKKCEDAGLGFFTVRASNIVEMDDVEIGEGALLSPFVTLTSNIRIGRHFHANLYAYVEHDCVIGDFVTFAPGVQCNGNIEIGDCAYIGAGAIIKQGTLERKRRIGAGAVVGMGAVVTKDVAPNVTVVGNPARPIGARG